MCIRDRAAAQGLIAGINAALSLKNMEPFILDRSDAYIGVMIDDLVTKGVAEPYRMFTSRAEYRLTLRSALSDLNVSLYSALDVNILYGSATPFVTKSSINTPI